MASLSKKYVLFVVKKLHGRRWQDIYVYRRLKHAKAHLAYLANVSPVEQHRIDKRVAVYTDTIVVRPKRKETT